MNDILELSAQLGKQIAADPRGIRMKTSREALEKSLPDRQLLSDYEQQQRKLMELEGAGKPIEPDDKRRLADLHGRVVGSPVLKDLLKAQADYLELMAIVTARIEEEALGLPPEPEDGRGR